jgi:aryl-alcohol dehydrogenase-like predicted oxidoreductase
MKFVNLGHSGLKVSRLCLGCMSFGEPLRGVHPWSLPEDESRPYLAAALEAWINFFDTANGYSAGSSEEITGRALRDMAKRDEVVIATKVFAPWSDKPNTSGLSRKAIFQAVDDSLSRLGTDYIDLYQIHRWDYQTPIEETLEALNDLVRAGKVRYLGASSMHAWQFMKALGIQQREGWARFISMQPQVNLIYREEEREMIPLCIDQGIGVIPWSPLGRGKLTRPWEEVTNRSANDQFAATVFAGAGYARLEQGDRKIVEAVTDIARERGVSQAQVALAWTLARPGITSPIIGTTRSHHLTDALAALDLELSGEETARLEAPYVARAVQSFV